MDYPIPSIPDEIHSTTLTFLEMCTYGLIRMDNDEKCINVYANKIGKDCTLRQLGFTESESFNFLQYLQPLVKIVEKRRGIIYAESNSNMPF